MRISAPSGFRHGYNLAWDHCVLCGDRLWPETMLGEYEGQKYCRAHLGAKLDSDIDPESFDVTEEREP
jgi:hypothetical protein